MDQAVESKPVESNNPAEGKKPLSGFLQKKAVKVVLCVLVGLIGVAVLAIALLPLWISPVATTVAEAVVPSVTGCDFKMEKFSLNPFSGKVRILGVHLSNPKGYKEPEAFSVATVNVEVATCSLLSSTIHVHDLTIQGPFVGITSENGTNNFMAILANVQSKLGTSKDEEKSKDESVWPSKKVIIDHFELSGTRVKLGMLPISLPTVSLNDIGKSSGGATFSEVGTEILNSSKQFVTGFGSGTTDMLKGIGSDVKGKSSDATKAIGDGAKSAAESLKKLNPFGK